MQETKATPVVKRGLFKSVRNYFREYCASTTIHGFKYFGEKRTILERVWWSVVFIICLMACVFSIYAVYMKWEQSPVIVSFATRGTPIFNIPFPAITICPETKFSQSDFNYTKAFRKKFLYGGENMTQEELTTFDYVSLLCNPPLERNFSASDKTFTNDFFTTIKNLTQEFEATSCYYMGKSRNCSDLFHPILTDEGICYTFNMLNRTDIYSDNTVHFNGYLNFEHPASNWTLEHGYPKAAEIETYPRRALLSGATKGFTFYIMSKRRDFDYLCNQIEGYKAILHTATRIPRPSQQYFRIPLNQEVVAAVQPVMITTSDSVKRYNPRRRECYFANERSLKFFKTYMSLNCMMECLTNITLDLCGCVAFFMPREEGTEICGTGSIECMNEAEDLMYQRDLNRIMSPTKRSLTSKGKACKCLPICSDLTYDAEVSQSDWDWEKIFTALGERTINKSEYSLSSLKIYFKSNNFITSQRNELYGPTDFLANFGGLLGLFTGFSVLSLMEILYFLTVRIYCNVRLYGFWAGPEI